MVPLNSPEARLAGEIREDIAQASDSGCCALGSVGASGVFVMLPVLPCMESAATVPPFREQFRDNALRHLSCEDMLRNAELLTGKVVELADLDVLGGQRGSDVLLGVKRIM